ncbi:MazG family protein [Amycolatopsis sp. CA-230715]|uniref:MazG family protein n=1 Tax=Amycolatopsis sp. CA-230715 TaxID=2745196 RepID=UPI001C00C4BA|nr:MazG family protein [Amycolatopsis sp. CA-230715]QWF82002.1 Nucleoside triphosphate pyrophosphohydrolase [Amycolatopsis sp. CA-230715]
MTNGVVVLVSGGGLPVAAWPWLRAAEVYAAPDLPETVRAALDCKPAPEPGELLAQARQRTVALIAARSDDPGADALAREGARVFKAEVPPLVRAAEVMDVLRSPGGCPWDAVQTHDSLRQYLVEETYELLEAIEENDRAALREELGDVLLQVLFHARVAAEHGEEPFGIDEVAGDLVDKLVGRHPTVFGSGDAVRTAAHQELKWEELKQAEKRRKSIVDGVALGQPAVALAGKLGQRSGRAGIPLDLFPAGTDPAEQLFRIAAGARRGGVDPEGELRAVAKRFAREVRAAEDAARAAGLDPATLEADAWRRFWPAR